ncbi:FAD-binding oxidoreductase [Actinoplanes sp. NPDC000266]
MNRQPSDISPWFRNRRCPNGQGSGTIGPGTGSGIGAGQSVQEFLKAVLPRTASRSRNARDVVAAVRFAASAGRPVAVQATGHGLADTLDGAVLVHTGRLDECVVHPEGWARVGAGVRWQQVLDAAAPHGLAPLCGAAPGVGELRRVTATESPELFWGVRGGKGALGIVTALEFDLVPLATLYAGALYFDGADAGTVLHAWRSWTSSLPIEATTSIAFLQLPPLPGVPPPLAGRFTVAVRFAWTGSVDEGAEVLAPLRAAATPLIDTVQTIPYAAIGSIHADPADPMPVHEATDLLRELPAEAADALLAVAGPSSGSPQVIVELRHLGGALAAEPEHPSAVCHRDAAFTLITIGVLAPPIAGAVPAHGDQVRAGLPR